MLELEQAEELGSEETGCQPSEGMVLTEKLGKMEEKRSAGVGGVGGMGGSSRYTGNPRVPPTGVGRQLSAALSG